jgi:hypothetical protein
MRLELHEPWAANCVLNYSQAAVWNAVLRRRVAEAIERNIIVGRIVARVV